MANVSFEKILNIFDVFSFINENQEVLFYIWLSSLSLCITYLFITRILQLIFRKIFNVGGAINYDILNKIFVAVQANNTIETMRLIEKYPHYINIQVGQYKYSPFLLACLHGSTPVVKHMLRFHADVTMKTARGETCFYLAAFHHISNPRSIDATCIRELYYAGADYNEPNMRGYSPIQLAASFGHKPLIKWLLEKGANIATFPSPYNLAHSQGHSEAASLLFHWSKYQNFMAIEAQSKDPEVN